MKELRLTGMPAVYDEVLAQARKRRQSAEAVFETLLEAEAAERRARLPHGPSPLPAAMRP